LSTSRVKLLIDSILGHASLVAEAVKGMCSVANLSSEDASLLSLCVFEAVTNSIRHAYHDEPDHLVEVVFSLDIDQIRIEVSDNGDPMEQPEEPDFNFDPDDIRNLPEGGMGLHIIYETMDQVAYESSDRKNTLTMIKEL
jgi:serine/threonine-protein kinase RsbW